MPQNDNIKPMGWYVSTRTAKREFCLICGARMTALYQDCIPEFSIFLKIQTSNYVHSIFHCAKSFGNHLLRYLANS